MWSYVVERVVKPANNEDLQLALQNNREVLQVFNSDIIERAETNRRTLDLLENRIARGDHLTQENIDLRERLMAETERRAYLEGGADVLRQISREQDAKLVSMASPLIKDMGVALRSSASKLEVLSESNGIQRRIMFLDKKMAKDISSSIVDEESVLILVKIVQYNTETGWGRLRIWAPPSTSPRDAILVSEG